MNRYYSIDFFKFFAAFGVVALHLVDILPDITDGIILIESIARFSVPFFFAVSGFLLASRSKSSIHLSSLLIDQNIVIKQIKSLLKIFITWYLIGFFLRNGFAVIGSVLGRNMTYMIPNIRILWYGSGVLWYLVANIWGIILLYIFSKFFDFKTIFIISIIFFGISLFGQGQVFENSTYIFQSREGLFFAFPYVTLGFIMFSLRDKINTLKIKNKILIMVAVISVLTTAIHLKNIYINIQYNLPTDIMPLIYILIIIIMIICIVYNDFFKKFKKINEIGKYSIGVYLIHMFLIATVNISFKFLPIGREIIGKSTFLFVLLAAIIFYLSFYIYKKINSIKLNFKSKMTL